MSRERAGTIEDDRVVVLKYTMKDGERVLDEASEASPFVYLHGRDNLVPALEKALRGREVGERFELEVDADEAFGRPREDEELVIPRDVLPLEVTIPPGTAISIRDDDEVRLAWIVREVGNHLVIRLAHPLAAERVRFELEVLKVREARPDELARGWATDPG